MSRRVGAPPTAWAADVPELGMSGAKWLASAGFAIAIALIFRIDRVHWIVTMTVGVAAAVLGLWMLFRPSARVAIVSNVVALVWIVVAPSIDGRRAVPVRPRA